METNKEQLLPEIEKIIQLLDIKDITTQRETTLAPLVTFVKNKIESQQPIRLNFICTHNSRRSHLSQIWAQTIAYYLGIKNVSCYSGGTEATALFPTAIDTMTNMGFAIKKLSETENPVYAIKYADDEHPIIGFSKTYDVAFNPKSGFAAIMTCSSADKGCPFVAGAEKRFPITFEDPKAFDNTPQQAEKYRERSLQIATELLYMFSKAIA